MTTKHPDYAILAARIAISNLHKETKKAFSGKTSWLALNIRKNQSSTLLCKFCFRIVKTFSYELEQSADCFICVHLHNMSGGFISVTPTRESARGIRSWRWSNYSVNLILLYKVMNIQCMSHLQARRWPVQPLASAAYIVIYFIHPAILTLELLRAISKKKSTGADRKNWLNSKVLLALT